MTSARRYPRRVLVGAITASCVLGSTIVVTHPVNAAPLSETSRDSRLPADSRLHVAALMDPDDPHFVQAEQWGLSGRYGVDAPTIWQHTTGESATVVAVIDSGILPHDDLDPEAMVAGYDMVSDPVLANDGSPRDDDPTDPGDWVTHVDAADKLSSAYGCAEAPSSWRGTALAAVIAAKTNNGEGIAAIAPDVRLQPIRAFGKCGGLAMSEAVDVEADVVDAIEWAAGGDVEGIPDNETPATVISFGRAFEGRCDDAVQGAIDDAVSRGTTVVVAAGDSDTRADKYWPANCRNVITVAAIEPWGERATSSNFGSAVDLAAPGAWIWSATNEGVEHAEKGSYGRKDGTDVAAAHVAGLAALVVSAHPGISPAGVEARLKTHVKPFRYRNCDSGSAVKYCGTGIAFAGAVTGSDVPPPEPVPYFTLPGSVRSLKVTRNGKKALVRWGLPPNTGGLKISGYSYRISRDGGVTFGRWKSTSRLKVIVQRAGGKRFAVQVAPVNSLGTGLALTRKLK